MTGPASYDRLGWKRRTLVALVAGLAAGLVIWLMPERTASGQSSLPQVTGVTATVNNHDSITVGWDESAAFACDGGSSDEYQVQWDDDSGFRSPDDSVSDSYAIHHGDTSFQIDGLMEDTEYFVRVRTVCLNVFGDTTSSGAWSTPNASVRTSLRPPARVSGVNAAAVSDTEIDVTWSNAVRAGGYIVRWGSASQTFDNSREVGTTTLTQRISGLIPDTDYYFQVIGTRTGAANGSPSIAVTARTQSAPTPVPVAGVSATAASDSEIKATWQSAQHATGYVVEWDVDSAFPAPDQAAVTGTEVIIERLRSETEYFVRVYGTRAYASDGPVSATDSATTDKARLKEWGDRFPGGPVAAQLALAAFGGVMAGMRFRAHKSPQREAEIVGVMCLASLILPIMGIGNIFWTGGIVLLIGLASVAAIFLTSRH